VARRWLFWLFSGLCTLSCGPDQAECSGPHADFRVELRLRNRPLPPDTVVHVTYGGSGTEDYSLQDQGTSHEVVFCYATAGDCNQVDASAPSMAAAGSSATDDGEVQAICCSLWTGGYATLEVRATGLATTSYDLTPREHACTVNQTFVLDSPDGG
jgi:hypothetical protein